MGLMSTSHLEQEAAVLALSTLMTIAPAQVYAEFEKVIFYLFMNFQSNFYCFTSLEF